MPNQRLESTITIGGALKTSFKKNIGLARAGLVNVGGAIKDVTDKQKELSRQSQTLEKEKQKADALDKRYKALGDDLSRLTQRQSQYRRAVKASSDGLRRVDDEIKSITKRKREIELLRKQFADQGKSVDGLDDEYKQLDKTLKGLEKRQKKWSGLSKKTSDGLLSVGRSIDQVKKKQKSIADQKRILDKNAKSSENLDKEYKKLGSSLDRLKRKQAQWNLVAKTSAKVGDRFNKMTSDVGRLTRRTSFAIGIASAVTFGLANSTATLGDNVAKTSSKLGVGINELQEYRYAAERSGIETRTFDMALQRATRRIAEASNGAGEAKDALKELSLDAQALAQMTPTEALDQIADALSTVENESHRVRLAFKLFDSEGVSMVNMLKDGRDGLQQLRKDARATGYVLSQETARDAEKFKDELLNTQLAAAGLKNTIGSALMPVFTDLMIEFNVWMRENRGEVVKFSKRFATGFRDSLPIIKQVVTGLATTAATFGTVIDATAKLVGGYDNLGVVVGTVFAGKAIISIGMFAKSLWDVGAAFVGLAGSLPAIATGVKAIGAALMANPIGLVIGGIAIGALLIYKYWEPISGFFKGLWEKVREPAKTTFEFFKKIFAYSPLGLVMKSWGVAFKYIESKLGYLGEAFEKVRDFFSFGGSDESQPPSRQVEERISRVAPRSANTQNVQTNYADTFNIYQQPGQTTQELADEIERRKRQRGAGALFDNPFSYEY